MGSASMTTPEELTVLITGFAPFKAQFPKNPSWEIASRLPDYLPPLSAKSSSARTSLPLPPVRLLVHPEPVKVSYETVRGLVPKLWAEDEAASIMDESSIPQHMRPRRIDLALHIGMAGSAIRYMVERRGHRDDYVMQDVDGILLEDDARHQREGKDWIWHGLPHELTTDIDLDDALKRWKSYVPPDSIVGVSEDAGHYLCDFIYYSSLATLYKRTERRRVAFMHVPTDASREAIESGQNIALALIRSLVETELSAKSKQVDLAI